MPTQDMTTNIFASFLTNCQLLDLHDNPTKSPPPETYFRGSKKIDFILGTVDVALAVSRAGILNYSEGLKYLDHRPLFVDLKETAIFGNRGVDPTTHRARGLRTSNRRHVERYCKLLHEKLDAHNIVPRCLKLRELARTKGVEAVKAEIESIDTQVTAAALKAERQSSNKDYGYPWSPSLAEAGQRVTFWRN